MVLMSFPLNTLQTPISKPNSEARYYPFGENTKPFLTEFCVMRVLIYSPLDTLHISIFLIHNPKAKYSPLGENTKLDIGPALPGKFLIYSPLDTLNTSI